MTEILKEGTVKKYYKKCFACGCEFQYSGVDIDFLYNEHQVKCPWCYIYLKCDFTTMDYYENIVKPRENKLKNLKQIEGK